MTFLERAKTLIDGKVAQRRLLREQVSELGSRIQGLEQEAEDIIVAKNILSAAMVLTQKKVKKRVEGLVTLALRSVFKDRDYHFVMEYTTRKDGRVDVSLLVRDGDSEPYQPEEEQGGGVVDIISFSLRPVMLSLEAQPKRKVLLLDEPFHFTGDLTELAGQMLKEVSHELGIQVIMITHDRERLLPIADRAWGVTMDQGRSVVRRMGVQSRESQSLRSRLLVKGKGRKQGEQTTGTAGKDTD